jgi:assimilatory nitrate reductase catalytic subunit
VRVASGSIVGDPDHPANYGRLCVKGAALKDAVDLPERLLQPTLHGIATSWDNALDHIAGEMLQIRDRHGPDAIAFYVSGQLLTEDYYVANKLMKGFIGSANIDTNSRLCMSSSVAGHIRAFGEDVVPGCYDDFEEADLVVAAGSNMAWCHPVLYQRLVAARERRGTKLVTIDPRRTATAETADLHLALKPGSDVALWQGLLAYLADAGKLDLDWIAQHVEGAEAVIAAARRAVPSAEAAAVATGLDIAALREFYHLFAATERTVTLYSQGVNQSSVGTDKVNAIINCHLATARIGRPGMGPFSLTGQPNAMGGREVGGLATTLAAHMNFTAADVDRVRRFWNAPRMATKPGFKAVEMFEAVREGKIKAIWIAATNPAASMPRASLVREALAACPLVIVSDAWATDTTAPADVVLPAAAWSEKDGTVTNSERRISRQRRFRESPGEAKADWWMFAELGRRMGWAEAFAYRTPADIFREHAALSGFENRGRRIFDLGALSKLDDAAYEALSPVQWPVGQHGQSPPRLFFHGSFPTESGKARMVALACAEEAKDADFPLVLNTGRLRDQWHTMTRTGRVASLMRHTPSPVLAVHPDSATEQEIAAGSLVRVETRHGAAVMRVALDETLRPGALYAAMHWTDQYTSSGPIGKLVHAAPDPYSGQPDLKGTPARLSPMPETWRGQLFRCCEGVPPWNGKTWWSKAQMEHGFAFDIAGWSALAETISSEQALRGLLGISDGDELVQLSFPRGSVYRFAAFDGDRLLACAFFGPAGAELPEAEFARDMLGKSLSALERLSLLSGTSGGTPARRSRTICSCFAVSEADIRLAIAEHGHVTVGDIGGHLRAGTNCGSCIPELKKLLADRKLAQVDG